MFGLPKRRPRVFADERSLRRIFWRPKTRADHGRSAVRQSRHARRDRLRRLQTKVKIGGTGFSLWVLFIPTALYWLLAAGYWLLFSTHTAAQSSDPRESPFA